MKVRQWDRASKGQVASQALAPRLSPDFVVAKDGNPIGRRFVPDPGESIVSPQDYSIARRSADARLDLLTSRLESSWRRLEVEMRRAVLSSVAYPLSTKRLMELYFRDSYRYQYRTFQGDMLKSIDEPGCRLTHTQVGVGRHKFTYTEGTINAAT